MLKIFERFFNLKTDTIEDLQKSNSLENFTETETPKKTIKDKKPVKDGEFFIKNFVLDDYNRIKIKHKSTFGQIINKIKFLHEYDKDLLNKIILIDDCFELNFVRFEHIYDKTTDIYSFDTDVGKLKIRFYSPKLKILDLCKKI